MKALFWGLLLLPALASAQVYNYTDGTLTASVTLSGVLPANSTTTVTPLSLTLTAGPALDIISGIDGAPFGVPQSEFTLGSSLFQFTTDANGNITGWNMDLTGDASEVETLNISSSQSGDTVIWRGLGGSDSTPFTQTSHYAAGSWVDPPLAAPEISSGGFPAGLTLLGLLTALALSRPGNKRLGR